MRAKNREKDTFLAKKINYYKNILARKFKHLKKSRKLKYFKNHEKVKQKKGAKIQMLKKNQDFLAPKKETFCNDFQTLCFCVVSKRKF